jgi:D-threo-aldose 1-dehydrogenase
VDIVLIHDPDDFMGQAADEAYPALAELCAQGVVKAIGVGMNAAAPLAWLIERCDLDCVLVAGRYTLLDQSAADVLFPLCLQRDVAVLADGVFNSGILAGPGDGARYNYAPASPALLARARRLRDACAEYDVPLAAASLRFTLRHPGVTAAVVGARTPEEHAGRNSRRRLLPLDAGTGRAVGRAEQSASLLTGAGPLGRLPRHRVGVLLWPLSVSMGGAIGCGQYRPEHRRPMLLQDA